LPGLGNDSEAPARCAVVSTARTTISTQEADVADSSGERLRIERSRKRVRVYLAGELVADTTRPFLVWEIPYYPAYYLPAADVRAELIATGKSDLSPSRGAAEVLDVKVSGATAAGAAVRYPDPRRSSCATWSGSTGTR
jgi:uncharacterized protein (DUF427 family)